MQIERNVIYGMYSGLALLMDVYRPDEQNGYGVVFISGCGWSAPLGWDARPLKESSQQDMWAVPTCEAGYTMFAINHRSAPRFQFPAQIEDAQRAVRFVRHHADEYGVRADRIGALGGSSGGHLVLCLGTMEGAGDEESGDPVARERGKVQCVVARAAPSNFLAPDASYFAFLGARPPQEGDTGSPEYRIHRDASPIAFVSSTSAPTLMIHGDRDQAVPYHLSESMEKALREANVPAELICAKGAVHGPALPESEEPLETFVEAGIAWFDKHLKA